MEQHISGFLHPLTPRKCHSGVGENSLFSNRGRYSRYLCFNVSIQFNNLNPQYNSHRYTDKHVKLYKLIQSLRDKEWSYRRISKYLNEEGILTANNKNWGVSGNSVYSVLRRYRQRKERLELRNKKYKPVWSKMWIEYDKNVQYFYFFGSLANILS